MSSGRLHLVPTWTGGTQTKVDAATSSAASDPGQRKLCLQSSNSATKGALVLSVSEWLELGSKLLSFYYSGNLFIIQEGIASELIAYTFDLLNYMYCWFHSLFGPRNYLVICPHTKPLSSATFRRYKYYYLKLLAVLQNQNQPENTEDTDAAEVNKMRSLPTIMLPVAKAETGSVAEEQIFSRLLFPCILSLTPVGLPSCSCSIIYLDHREVTEWEDFFFLYLYGKLL
ncbi:hypothetical protein MUK42_34459 [Musa troglodytarum]|uniref:Uncharacterized protein n=1 Tax=Musa troglodytarum TaxID=320322 RepID=A0A9E7FAG9_9LILI|nr:hypothetical protein MUK42_34459 [Musa troglodytarum]